MIYQCPKCGGKTSKYCAEVYVCHNREKCRNIINVESLYKILRDIGVDEKVIAKVRNDIIAGIL